jgi:hypothetical protein
MTWNPFGATAHLCFETDDSSTRIFLPNFCQFCFSFSIIYAGWTRSPAAKLWVIPSERMKNGSAHAMPLMAEILALLDSLPRFSGGDFLFSTTGDQKPVSGFSRRRLDSTS